MLTISKSLYIKIIRGCKRGKLKYQEMLYRQFYAYGMSVSLRYSNTREEATEILNDSFLKVFNNLNKYDTKKPFRSWFRRIIINTSIDYYRRDIKKIKKNNIDDYESLTYNQNQIENLEAEDILKLLNSLPKIQKIIFNMYEIEGYKHEEIAKKFNISESTSRANLSRAKKKLRELFKKQYRYARVI